ncbi:hypothetical protein JCM19000A_19010 [Silvimonas sp. JCM 19000]
MSEVVPRLSAYTHYIGLLAAVIVPAVLLFSVVSVLVKVQLMRLGISRESSMALADVATFSTLSLLCSLFFWREVWRHSLLTWGVMFRPVCVGMIFNFYFGLAIVTRLVTDQVWHMQTGLAIGTAFALCALVSSVLGWTLLHLRPHGYAAVV